MSALRDGQDQAKTVSLGLLFILAGMVISHGAYLDPTTFFTPWHHDDFEALEGVKALVFSVRPVSSHIIHFLGGYGERVYYTAFALLWFCALAATLCFVLRVLRLQPGRFLFALYAGAGSVLWFLQPQSTQNLQYLGLMTNTLSYLFGMLAGLSILCSSEQIFLGKKYLLHLVGVCIFALLSAFSKEDMILFLMLTSVFSGLTQYRVNLAMSDVWKHLSVSIGVIGLSYGAGFVYSWMVKSPFVMGEGEYDVSAFLINIQNNLVFYLAGSVGFMLLVASLVLVAGLLAVFLRYREKSLSLATGLLFLVACALALMGPYLVLPRQFGFYAMNFVPILAFSVAPAAFAVTDLVCQNRFSSLVGWFTLSFVVLMSSVFFVTDGVARTGHHRWLAGLRQRSAIQMQEILRNLDLGLGGCRGVWVSGVSNEFGPFLNSSEIYLNRKIERAISWRIVVVPESLLDTYTKARPQLGTARWTYVKPDEAVAPADCELRFDSKTLAAKLKPAQPSLLTSPTGR